MSNQIAEHFPLDGASDKPLVTFALFAYNQEKYIREAVEGAFSQNYLPLEIILSDDCSTDRTFEIMEEMVKEYTGPHRIKLNRNTKNLGIVRHVFHVASLCKSEYFVVAAGDDISKPRRTSELIEMFKTPNILGVCSGYDVINENSVVIQEKCLAPKDHKIANFFLSPVNRDYVVLQGSTSAYRRKVFFYLGDIKVGHAEDNFLNFLIYANGGIVAQTSSPLVLYRQHQNAVHHKIKITKSPSIFEKESYANSLAEMEKLEGFKAILGISSSSHLVNRMALERELRQYKIVCIWPTSTFLRRVHLIFHEIVFHKSIFLKWQVARILGQFPNYQPKIFLSAILRNKVLKNGKP